ncbi:transport and Golgi organization protein 1 homolog [Sardina pilchardus]|uniref:transport and Golgi organization protein 1 homolog n=1 Tax=Sardina pilchardus TaxID=27697 RepID=UPI002E0FE7AB
METMEDMGTILFWYFMTFSRSLFFMAVVQLLFVLKTAINGKLKERHGIESKLDDRVLQLFDESYEARITDLNLKNKKLQDQLQNSIDSQRCIEQENEGLKRENKDMEEKIKLLNQTVFQEREKNSGLKEMASKNQRKVPSARTFLVAVFSMVLARIKVQKQQTVIESYQKHNVNLKNQVESVHAEMECCRKENASLKDQVQYATIQIEVERRHMAPKLTALQHKIQELEKELEGKDNSCKAQMASLEQKAHKRLVKASALQRQLNDKKAEVFFLHHSSRYEVSSQYCKSQEIVVQPVLRDFSGGLEGEEASLLAPEQLQFDTVSPGGSEEDAENECSDAEEDAPPRKRLRAENTWKKVINKKRRMVGKSYVGKQKQEEIRREPRSMGPGCSSAACAKSGALTLLQIHNVQTVS